MLENQLSRYGSITKAIPYLQPGAKLFLVCDSDDTTVGPLNLGNEFPVDKDGLTRVYTTIQAAVNAASANRGDVVLVLQGYDHTLGRADSWATAGVHIVGLGDNNSRPIIRYTSTTDEVGVAANNVHIKNLRFLSAVDSCARALDFDTGFTGGHLEECVFDFNATGNDFRVMVRAGQARSLYERNRFLAEDTAGSGRAISLRGLGGSYTTIENNYIFGQYDTVGDTTNGAAAIGIDSTDTQDVAGLLIKDNMIVNTDTAVAVHIRIADGGTYNIRGLIKGNYLGNFDSSSADTTKIASGNNVGVGMRCLDNHMNGDSSTEKIVGDTVVVA